MVVASRRVLTLAVGRAARFFSIVSDGDAHYLFGRDGRFPNAAPDERLIAWPPGVLGSRGDADADEDQARAALHAASRADRRVVRLVAGDGRAAEERETVPGHNFAVLVDRAGGAHVYGGRADSNESGVAHFRAASVRALATGAGAAGGDVVVRGDHSACLEGRAAKTICEWDGKLSAAYVRGGRVALYGRFNTAKMHRWMQVAFADRPEGPFGPFSPVAVQGWDGCHVRRASVYYAAVDENPVDASTVLGLFPVHYPAKYDGLSRDHEHACYLGLGLSCDGRHFGHLEKLLDLNCAVAMRTLDYPVDGFLVDDAFLHVFVHREMPTDDLIKQGANVLAPRIVRHSVPLDSLRAFTARSKAALPSCAEDAPPYAPLPADAPLGDRHPPCRDENGDLSTEDIPFSKLNYPDQWAKAHPPRR